MSVRIDNDYDEIIVNERNFILSKLNLENIKKDFKANSLEDSLIRFDNWVTEMVKIYRNEKITVEYAVKEFSKYGESCVIEYDTLDHDFNKAYVLYISLAGEYVVKVDNIYRYHNPEDDGSSFWEDLSVDCDLDLDCIGE